MKTYYIVSGGFDPIHEGHVEMIKASALASDGVIVLANSDDWLCRKKGKKVPAQIPDPRRCNTSGGGAGAGGGAVCARAGGIPENRSGAPLPHADCNQCDGGDRPFAAGLRHHSGYRGQKAPAAV